MLIKEYEVNEAVLVTYNTLDSLYKKYRWNYPNKIVKRIEKLINDLGNDLESQQNKDYSQYDIEKSYYVEKIIFEDEKKYKNLNDPSES